METEMNNIVPKKSVEMPGWILFLCFANILYLVVNIFFAFSLFQSFEQKFIPVSSGLLSIAGIISLVGLSNMQKWGLYSYTIVFVINLLFSASIGDMNPISLIVPVILLTILWGYWINNGFKDDQNYVRNSNADEVKLSQEFVKEHMQEELPILIYTAPQVKSTKKTVQGSFFIGKIELFELEFDDGLKGVIQHDLDEKTFYFKRNSKKRDKFEFHYFSYLSCINALHFYLTKNDILKIDYKGSYVPT